MNNDYGCYGDDVCAYRTYGRYVQCLLKVQLLRSLRSNPTMLRSPGRRPFLRSVRRAVTLGCGFDVADAEASRGYSVTMPTLGGTRRE